MKMQEFERLPEPGLAVPEGSGHGLAKASPDSLRVTRAGAEALLCAGVGMGGACYLGKKLPIKCAAWCLYRCSRPTFCDLSEKPISLYMRGNNTSMS